MSRKPFSTNSKNKPAPVEGETATPKFSASSAKNNNPPLPRSRRKRTRSKADRGLPQRTDLKRLARVYLETQSRLWPKFADRMIGKRNFEDLVEEMVNGYIKRHRGGEAKAALSSLSVVAPGCQFAGVYCRFSCENSESTSIDDQLVNCLRKSHSEGRFIPWEYVYADYSVTGLNSSRRGYASYKETLANPAAQIESTYIDDFTRASRDELEWWRLAYASKNLNKRMVGASDAFDLGAPDWDIKVTLYGLISRLFIRSLRQKVKRGMAGAARRFSCLGKLPLGFTRRQKIDAAGNPLAGADGMPLYEPCRDPVTAADLLRIFQLFVEENWSVLKICNHFNEMNVDNWNGWSCSAIAALLRNPTAIGVFVFNRTRSEYDFETGTTIKVKNPRSEWEVSYVPDQAVVPLDLWRAACRKLAAKRRKNRQSGRKPSRNSIRPTTLFSGTLICQCCGRELTLIRSVGNCRQLGCVDGHGKRFDCKLKTSKSVRLIEECLLPCLQDTLLTDEVVEQLVEKANSWLDAEASRPAPKLAPLQKQSQNLKRQIERLVRSIAVSDDDTVAATCRAEMKRLQIQLSDLQREIRDIEKVSKWKARRLSVEDAKLELADLRSVLAGEVAIAGPAIRELTGPISIREEKVEGRRTSRWIASFSPDFRGLANHIFEQDVPPHLLNQLQEQERHTVEVVIDRLPRYEAMAKEFARMRDAGATINAIAAAHGTVWQEVAISLKFWDTGERPTYAGRKKKRGPKAGVDLCKYKAIANDVVRLRDVEQKSFSKIAIELDVSESTVQRAYNAMHPEIAHRAISSGSKLSCPSRPRLDPEIFRQIETLNGQGKSVKQIATALKCGLNTVRRHLEKIKSPKLPNQSTT